MGNRHQHHLTFIDEGDIEIYHPACRSKVLIVSLSVARKQDGATQLYCEGICPTCNTYVYLALRNEHLQLEGDAACTPGRQGRRRALDRGRSDGRN